LDNIPVEQQTLLLHRVLDIAGQLVYDMPRDFVYQDREDPNSKEPPTKKEISDVRKHFRDNPPIIKLAPITDYGHTHRDVDSPVVTLNSALVQDQQSPGQFWRLLVLGITSVIHELSHWKMKLIKDRISPSKFKFHPYDPPESGEWVEKRLSDGLIRPGNKKIGSDSDLLRIEGCGIDKDVVNLVDDKFGYQLLEHCTSGKQTTVSIWQEFLKNNLMRPSSTPKDAEWRYQFCQIARERYLAAHTTPTKAAVKAKGKQQNADKPKYICPNCGKQFKRKGSHKCH